MRKLFLAVSLACFASATRAWDPAKPFIYEMKIAFEMDNWTNMYSTATVLSKSDNTVAFRVVANSTTNPTYQLVVTTQGNVGIGTATPWEMLEISKSGGGNGIRFNSAGVAEYKMGIPSGESVFRIVNTNALAAGAYSTNGIIIDINGNVGIGTTNPVGIFQVGDPNTSSGGMVFKTMSILRDTATTYFTATTITRFTGQVELTCVSDGDPNRQLVETARLAYPSATATVISTSGQNLSAAWSVSGSNLQVTLTGGGGLTDCTFRITGATTSAGGV